MQNKFNFIIEIVWLVIAILGLAAGVHKTVISGINESYPFFIITIISIFIYTLRRHFRLAKKDKPSD